MFLAPKKKQTSSATGARRAGLFRFGLRFQGVRGMWDCGMNMEEEDVGTHVRLLRHPKKVARDHKNGKMFL